jgi:hypothetical protein
MRRCLAVVLGVLLLAGGAHAEGEVGGSAVVAAVKKAPAKKTAAKKGRPRRAARRRRARRRPAPARTQRNPRRQSGPVTVPVDLGIGPAFHWISGPIQDDRAPHFGIKLSLAAIIDRETIAANKGRIPKKYRGMASKIDELRYTPTIFIPDTIYLSPPTDAESTAMYGLSFRPIGIGLPIIRVPRVRVGADLDLTYAYIDGEKAGLGTTHFLRPGLAVGVDIELPLSKVFLVSVGWVSTVYPPQEVGGEIFALGALEDSIWHIGQAYVQLHFRFPYSVDL